ncbi:MAG TPA: GNAT family N-acetyltransferase, partial [Parasegetibacter sp.]
QPVWWAFCAESDNVIHGFALYYIRYSTWKGQRMYLEDIVVTENMRGKGIGKLLFDALIEEAKQKKLNGISWQVLDWNQPAINFYKKYKADFDSEWINCSLEF